MSGYCDECGHTVCICDDEEKSCIVFTEHEKEEMKKIIEIDLSLD